MTKQRKPEMGKYLLWCFFHKDEVVRRHLPATARYTRTKLKDYLQRFGMVYVKPVAGSRGRGILRVEQHGRGVVVQHTVQPPKTFATIAEAAKYIDNVRSGSAYIIQQGIHLARFSGRPFDIRVMVQREKPGGSWKYSGMLAKVAGPRSVVTNVALGKGHVVDVGTALKSSLGWGDKRVQQCLDDLVSLSLRAARHFDSYLLYRELGFDLAIDKRGRIWMLEQNTGPSHALFAHLKSNLSMYRTIQSRAKQYRSRRKQA